MDTRGAARTALGIVRVGDDGAVPRSLCRAAVPHDSAGGGVPRDGAGCSGLCVFCARPQPPYAVRLRASPHDRRAAGWAPTAWLLGAFTSDLRRFRRVFISFRRCCARIRATPRMPVRAPSCRRGHAMRHIGGCWLIIWRAQSVLGIRGVALFPVADWNSMCPSRSAHLRARAQGPGQRGCFSLSEHSRGTRHGDRLRRARGARRILPSPVARGLRRSFG